MEKIRIDDTAYVQSDSRSQLIPTNKEGFFVAVCDQEYKSLGKCVSLVTDTLSDDARGRLLLQEVQGKLFRVLGSTCTKDFIAFPNKTMLTDIRHRFLQVKDASPFGILTRRMGIASLLMDVLDGVEEPLEFEYSRRPSRIAFEMKRGFVPESYIFQKGKEVSLTKGRREELLLNVNHRLATGLDDVDMFDHVVKLKRESL